MRYVLSLILAAGLFTSYPTAYSAGQYEGEDPKGEFDRLDGHGKSGKRVDVIEWEGNLEIHVYPKGSLAGLALKLDKKNKDKPVMVIGYRFVENARKQLIRRAILGIPMNEGFKAFKDPSADEYDKMIISNNGLSGQVVAFKLDADPVQLYPDGHPSLAQKEDETSKERQPASKKGKQVEAGEEEPSVDEDGGIKPFFMERRYKQQH